jgi:hypothetical protein
LLVRVSLLFPAAWVPAVAIAAEGEKKVSPLKVFAATGPNKGKELDYTRERKDKPTVYAFVQADRWDRPMARFLRGLDEAVRKEGQDAAVIAVWLTDNPDKAKEYLPVAQESLQFQAKVLAVFPGDKAGPEGWGIGDAHLTVVVVNKGRKAATFDYRSVNETDVPGVHEALKKAIGGK